MNSIAHTLPFGCIRAEAKLSHRRLFAGDCSDEDKTVICEALRDRPEWIHRVVDRVKAGRASNPRPQPSTSTIWHRGRYGLLHSSFMWRNEYLAAYCSHRGMAESTRSLLSTIHIFAGLDEEVMDSLAEVCKECNAEPGEIIVKQNDVANQMFVIAKGEVEIIKHLGSAEEIVLARMGSGEFFGEMCIIECMPRAATVRARQLTALYSLRNTDLLRLFRRWPDQYAILVLNISRDLCRRLRALDELLCTLLMKNGGAVPMEIGDKPLRIE